MMRKMLNCVSILSLGAFIYSCATVEDVSNYAPIEHYPNDTLLASLETKKALIVIAHDDDMCALSGTVSWLNSQGWQIRVLSSPSTPERNAAQVKACAHVLDSVLFFEESTAKLRRDLDTTLYPYRPIHPSYFTEIFDSAPLEKRIIAEFEAFQPSVIFTLDSEIGGYGHPEHVLVSQLVLRLAETGTIAPMAIYQSVFTDHMEETIMARHARRLEAWGIPSDGWEFAKATYGVSGMPEPSVQVNIEEQGTQKMNYLRSYNVHEQKTIGFFIPAFYEYSAEDYFHLFDREFFRVLRFN